MYDNVDPHPNFIIQTWAGNNESKLFNKNGFVLDFFHDAKKSYDNFSPIKSNNYLAYAMGAFFAKKNNLSDCLLYNCYNRICEATIANVFIITNGVIKTPALTEGCVNGVMRKYLIACFKKEGLACMEGEIFPEELLTASEVFLTNALYGMRWVKTIGTSNYTNAMTTLLHQKFIVPLFA